MTPTDLAGHLLSRRADTYRTAIILGSGLGPLADDVEDAVHIPYDELAGFPVSGVSSHSGALVLGRLAGLPVVLLSGRSHYYEHGDARVMALPIRTLAALGCTNLVLTNAAGSLREDMPPGSLMLIADHINYSGMNPLIGEAGDDRFVDMSQAYDPSLRQRARKVGTAVDIPLHEGVYLWFSGPSFETPAEIRMARILGADAVGMSTVPEAILARHQGMNVAAISSITNFGAGMTDGVLSHAETKAVAARGVDNFKAFVTRLCGDLAHDIT